MYIWTWRTPVLGPSADLIPRHIATTLGSDTTGARPYPRYRGGSDCRRRTPPSVRCGFLLPRIRPVVFDLGGSAVQH